MTTPRKKSRQALGKSPMTESQWAEIRRHYEFDPDEPSLPVATARAVEQLKFDPPSNVACWKRATKADDPWTRRGSLNSINAAAQRKADAIVAASDESAAPHQPPAPHPPAKPSPIDDAKYAVQVREAAEDQRAEVLARHRQEWRQIAGLRQEALAYRKPDPAAGRMTADIAQAMDRSRLAKLAAETTAIQQAGERRAWGLDDLQIPDMGKKTDAELRAILNGQTLM